MEKDWYISALDIFEGILGELKRYSRKKRNPFALFRYDAPIALTHEKITELTGLNRVTVTRTLKLLKQQGDIDINEQGRIVLLRYML